MLSNEDCPFSHEGSGEVVNDPKKVDESGALMRFITTLGEIPDSQSQNEQFPNAANSPQSNIALLLLVGAPSERPFPRSIETSAGSSEKRDNRLI